MPSIPALPQFNPLRFRSYVFRLPLFTRIALFLIVVVWIAELQSVWSVEKWGALIPSEINITTLYRLNTYPFIHLGFLHAFFNCLALVPLMERFEAEHGTLLSFVMFTGPLSTFPAAGYLIVERGIFGGDTAVEGASVWVFVLLGVEAIKTYRSDPYFTLSTTKIPTWTTPLILATVIKILVPATSFLGHLCAVSTGYLFGLGYLKFMAPPEKIMRWIEGKLNLLGRLPHYVSIDQKTFGRYGVLPTREAGGMTLRELGGGSGAGDANGNTGSGYIGSTQRLGP